MSAAQLDSTSSGNRFAQREMLSHLPFSVPEPGNGNRGALAAGGVLSGGAIAGIVIGALVGCAVIAGESLVTVPVRSASFHWLLSSLLFDVKEKVGHGDQSILFYVASAL